MWTGSSH